MGFAALNPSCALAEPATVMAGLVPAIHVFVSACHLIGCPQDVDARDTRGHDEPEKRA